MSLLSSYIVTLFLATESGPLSKGYKCIMRTSTADIFKGKKSKTTCLDGTFPANNLRCGNPLNCERRAESESQRALWNIYGKLPFNLFRFLPGEKSAFLPSRSFMSSLLKCSVSAGT
ncbi:1b542782-44fe-43df-9de7-9b79e2921078 [Sclerotinia trifoliorum]|uniref:1b542782-44fe-43df-9de7-9b79e2921078 n=1 Tax=Sclerotinia trifoliorum TaxID=28548 RepID=A0A8H2ZLA6_9HELO|nr:1b542782-44fe-43df-9de7-9b79e2921078 [Sclerotinia trifoliorum]